MRTLLLITFLFPVLLSAQPVIYKDAQTTITGTWAGANSTLTEVTGETPFEGTKHFKFTYTISDWWAGLGLNMDNWNSSQPRDFSNYSHLRISYRGLGAGQVLRVQLRNNTTYSNSVDIGGTTSTYGTVDVPIITLLAGSGFAINAVREVDLSVGGVQSGSGTVYFDAIELVNISGGNTGSPASAATWGRANSLSVGLNTANWLEAYWLMPFNAYPETNKFTRTKIRDLRNIGFQDFRLPITFERMAGSAPNYTLDFNLPALRLVDSMILWANLYDFKLIIDNHHGFDLTDGNYTTELPRLKAIWAQIATHYDYLDPEKFFFEIYNEPTPSISNANWRTVASALVTEIRLHEGSPHSIFVGANSWNAGGQLVAFTPLDDADIIYTFHNYDPYYFTHQGMSWTSPAYFAPRTFPQGTEVQEINNLMAAVSDWSDNYNVPVSLGEFGCSSAADAQSRCNWINAMMTAINTNGFSYFYWDATSSSDGFGFFNGGIIDQAHVVPCFASAMGLMGSVLPISLEEFKVNCQDQQVQLRWLASTQGQGYQFDIQRSMDGQKWESVAIINAKEDLRDYQFTDEQVSTFYRLRLISPDGRDTYSPIRQIDCSGAATVQISPNPVQDHLQIRVTSDKTDLVNLNLYDVSGRVVTQLDYSSGAPVREATFLVNDLPAGTYWLVSRLSDGSSQRTAITKQ